MSPVVQSQGLFKSITYALRSRANVTDYDSNGLEWTHVGHILVTVIVRSSWL